MKKFSFNRIMHVFFLFLLTITFLVITYSCAPVMTASNSKSIKDPLDILSPYSTSKTLVELFVMSQCPYGIEAEKAIIPALKEFQDQVDFYLYFIADEADEKALDGSFEEDVENFVSPEGMEMELCRGEAIYEGGRFKSLHGQAEIDENIRQAIIAKYYPQRFLDYLLYRAENYQENEWEQAAVSASPLTEQRRIVANVNSLMALCDCLIKTLADKENRGEKLLNAVGRKVAL